MTFAEILPIVLPLLGLQLILLVAALIDWTRREPERINGRKNVWLAVILLLSIPGLIAYFVLGRRD